MIWKFLSAGVSESLRFEKGIYSIATGFSQWIKMPLLKKALAKSSELLIHNAIFWLKPIKPSLLLFLQLKLEAIDEIKSKSRKS